MIWLRIFSLPDTRLAKWEPPIPPEEMLGTVEGYMKALGVRKRKRKDDLRNNCSPDGRLVVGFSCHTVPGADNQAPSPLFRRVDGEILVGRSILIPKLTSRPLKIWLSSRNAETHHLALHLCREITANCGLLIGWAAFVNLHVNWEALPELLQKGLRAFQVAAEHARTAAFAVVSGCGFG